MAALELTAQAAVSFTETVVLRFTPWHALAGGLILGVATAGKLLTTGRILGISGAVKGLANSDLAPWRFAFLTGMAAGGIGAGQFLPGALGALPASFPMGRTALAGLLVGYGSSIGNGCTSGHGICGTARGSSRSLAYTATFMLSGIATALLANTAQLMHVAQVAPLYQAITAPEVIGAAAVAALTAAGFALLVAVARRRTTTAAAATAATAAGPTAAAATNAAAAPSSPTALELLSEGLAGLAFSIGLAISGMTHPEKVAGFLALGTAGWDPSLPFVMGGAVLVAAVAFQAVLRFRLIAAPFLTSAFSIPTATAIDARLLLGGVLFGVGWGLAGICPGPAIANIFGQPSPHMATFLVGAVLGMVADAKLSRWLVRGKK